MLVSSSHWFNFAGFILGAALILCGAFLEQIKALWRRIHKPVKIIICVLLAALLIHFGAFEAKVISFASLMPSKQSAEAYISSAQDLEPSNVVVVSSSFHLYRASLIAQKQGYDTKTMSFLGSQGLKILMPHYYLREYAAYVRELL